MAADSLDAASALSSAVDLPDAGAERRSVLLPAAARVGSEVLRDTQEEPDGFRGRRRPCRRRDGCGVGPGPSVEEGAPSANEWLWLVAALPDKAERYRVMEEGGRYFFFRRTN